MLVVAGIWWNTRSRVQDRARQVAGKPVAVVFGAGLIAGGKPSLILQNRLDGAIELFREGKVPKLLMSGDNRVASYNEPKAMRDYALDHGVPARAIVLDYAGRDTYDTCYRAKHVFGVDEAVFVTQGYHAPRALYVGRALGIDAVALSVPSVRHSPGLQASYVGRECVADLKAWWDINVSHRRPYIDSK